MMPRRAAALVAFLLAVVAVLPPGPALVGAEGEPASTAAPEPTATPVAVVAVPEIAARIEETAAVLRKLADGNFETVLTVDAAKFYASGKGAEKPAPPTGSAARQRAKASACLRGCPDRSRRSGK